MTAKLGGLGAAYFSDDDSLSSGPISPQYLSPEMMDDLDVYLPGSCQSEKTDMYTAWE